MVLEFQNKVVIVSGSGSGIGRATALEFARQGAKVVITDRNSERLAEVEQEFNTEFGNAKCVLAIVADVTIDEDLQRLVDTTLQEFGSIDVLVNCVGVVFFSSIFDSNAVASYDDTMRTNLRSAFVLSHKVIPHLVKTKGNIVNISSIRSIKPIASTSAYCMSKTALDMFTNCLALEVGPHGVRVNSVQPGVIKTNFHIAMGISKVVENNWLEYKEKVVRLRRNGEPEDIAHLVVFLASSKSINMTGSTILSDSGGLWSANSANESEKQMLIQSN